MSAKEMWGRTRVLPGDVPGLGKQFQPPYPCPPGLIKKPLPQNLWGGEHSSLWAAFEGMHKARFGRRKAE